MNGIAIAPDRETLISASGDGTLNIWDLCSGQKINTLRGHIGWVTCVGVAPEGLTLVSGGRGGTVKIWGL